MTIFDLIIVGGGPAGLAAGIQAGHMGLAVKVLEKGEWGGRLRLARKVENIPGLTLPLSGAQVADRMVRQARRKGVSLVLEACNRIDYAKKCFRVYSTPNRYAARAVIIACGVEPDRLLIPGLGAEPDCLFYSWQLLPHVRDKRVGVIGGGESAFDQACSLAEGGAVVTIFVRGPRPRTFRGLVEEAQDLGVSIITGAGIRWAEKKGPVVSLQFYDGHDRWWEVDYLLAAVGASPADVTISVPALDRAGKDLFWAGDVCSGRYRQAAIAAGDGVKTAMIVNEYVRGE